MAKYVPISPQAFGGSRWRRFPDYRFAAAQALIPLIGVEVVKAAHAMPITFVPDGPGFALAALTSTRPDSNAFVGPQGQWLGGYVPATLRTYPFRLMRRPGANDWVLCFDEDSGLLGPLDGDGDRFYEEDGQVSSSLQALKNALAEMETSRAGTKTAVAALQAEGVLKPWELTFKGPTGEHKVAGLFSVDEAALAALADAAYLRLRAATALPLAFAQLFSVAQLAIFENLAKAQAYLFRASGAPGTDSMPFSIADDASIRFD